MSQHHWRHVRAEYEKNPSQQLWLWMSNIGAWHAMGTTPLWSDGCYYAIGALPPDYNPTLVPQAHKPPKAQLVQYPGGKVKFPAPEKWAPKLKQRFYYVDYMRRMVCTAEWQDSTFNSQLLQLHFVHLDAKAAERHLQAYNEHQDLCRKMWFFECGTTN